MLRKRSRPAQNQCRSQLVMGDHGYDTSFYSDGSESSPKPRAAARFFTVPGLFVGLCSKGSSADYDTSRSPTSPLELRGSPKLGSSFSRSPRSPGLDGRLSPRSWWDCSRVGLGLVDSLSDGTKPCGKAVGSSGIKNILFGSKMRISIPSHHLADCPLVSGPKSLPKDYIESSFRQLGPSKSMLGSGSAGLEPGEFVKSGSCSPDVVASSLPLSRLIYCNLKTNCEVVSSDRKDSQLGSPLLRGGMNLDEFSGSLPMTIGSSNGRVGSLSRSKIEDYTSTNSLPKDYIDRQTGRPKSMLGSGSTELETGELVKNHSCSANDGASSLPLSRLLYHDLKTNCDAFASDVKDFQLGSPLANEGKNFDELSGSLPIAIITPSNGFMSSLTPSEIELSEDYTCIISHGPNPKTTHIFGDCILEDHSFPSLDRKNRTGLVEEGGDSPPHPVVDFLSSCFSCKKKLEEGKDIYIYRGEKAFCSGDCRDQEIMVEEEIAKPAADTSDLTASSFEEEIFI